MRQASDSHPSSPVRLPLDAFAAIEMYPSFHDEELELGDPNDRHVQTGRSSAQMTVWIAIIGGGGECYEPPSKLRRSLSERAGINASMALRFEFRFRQEGWIGYIDDYEYSLMSMP